MNALTALWGSAKEFARNIWGFFRFLWQWLPGGSHRTFNVGFGESIGLLLKGFGPDAAQLYNFETRNRDDYLSDYEIFCKASLINTRYTSTFNDKLILTGLMSAKVAMPRILGYIRDGRLCPGPASGWSTVLKTAADTATFLKAVLMEEGTVILRPNLGHGRDRDKFVTWEGENGFRINNYIVPATKIHAEFNNLDEYILTSCPAQATYSSAIYPYCWNTIRILTMIDPVKNTAFPAGQFHRFGTKGSGLSDNLKHGGCLAYIAPHSGRITACITAQGRERAELTKHPDTGADIVGTVVPNFEAVMWQILKLHQNFTYVSCLAWDILMQNDGFYLLETNPNPDLKGIQAFEPILTRLPIREYYHHHRVIKR